jgi:protein involved in polysaccharide export with SLBB domain
LLLACPLALLSPSPGHAATPPAGEGTTPPPENDLQALPQNDADIEKAKQVEALKNLPIIVQSGAVDPARYVLGPGDVVELDLWGQFSRTVVLTVSPEGTVLLPGVGTFMLAGRTLAEMRERLLKRVAENYRGVHADLRLLKLRSFKVYLTGMVKNPGPVAVNSTTRASEAVIGVGLATNGSHRNIQVRHRDSTTVRLDLDLFSAAGLQDLDPTLIDGDVVYVPRALEFIEVTGAVGSPGRFELAPNDSLGTLLQLSHGLLPAAVANHALLVRFLQASTRESVWVDLTDPTQYRMTLRDGDGLFVHFRPDYHVLSVAGIYGEVERPGSYPIVLGHDRFSDLIRWGGGFRPLANRTSIHLVRSTAPTEAGKDPEFDRLVRLSRSEMTESEYAKFSTRLAETKNVFLIDWSRIEGAGHAVDPLLQANDVVRVDQLVPTVRVEGEVKHPGFVDFSPERSLKDYVELSGGYTQHASASGVRVSPAVTGQVIPARNLKVLQPGDFIWVPERKDVDAWGVFRDVVAVASQVAVLVYTLGR